MGKLIDFPRRGAGRPARPPVSEQHAPRARVRETGRRRKLLKQVACLAAFAAVIHVGARLADHRGLSMSSADGRVTLVYGGDDSEPHEPLAPDLASASLGEIQDWLVHQGPRALTEASRSTTLAWPTSSWFDGALQREPTLNVPLAPLHDGWRFAWARPAALDRGYAIVLTWQYKEGLVDDLQAVGKLTQTLALDWPLATGSGYLLASDGALLGHVTPQHSTIEIYGPAAAHTTSDRRIWAVLQIEQLSQDAAALQATTLTVPLPVLRLLDYGYPDATGGAARWLAVITSYAAKIALAVATLILLGITVGSGLVAVAQRVGRLGVWRHVHGAWLRITSARQRLAMSKILAVLSLAVLMNAFILPLIVADSALEQWLSFRQPPLAPFPDHHQPLVVSLDQAAKELPCMEQLKKVFPVYARQSGFARLAVTDIGCLSAWTAERAFDWKPSQTTKENAPLAEPIVATDDALAVLVGYPVPAETVRTFFNQGLVPVIGGDRSDYGSMVCVAGRCTGFVGPAADFTQKLATAAPWPDDRQPPRDSKTAWVWLLHDLRSASSRAYFATDHGEDEHERYAMAAQVDSTYSLGDVTGKLPSLFLARGVEMPLRDSVLMQSTWYEVVGATGLVVVLLLIGGFANGQESSVTVQAHQHYLDFEKRGGRAG